MKEAPSPSEPPLSFLSTFAKPVPTYLPTYYSEEGIIRKMPLKIQSNVTQHSLNSMPRIQYLIIAGYFETTLVKT